MLVVLFSYAGTHPWAVMIHLLDADSADITVFGPRGSVDVAGEAKFYLADFSGIRDDI